MAGNINSVGASHPMYDRSLYSWVLVRDTIEGEAAVKTKGPMYLPMPAAMQYGDYANKPSSIKTRSGAGWFGTDPYSNRLSATLHDPNYHANPAYAAYLSRSQFPELAGFILRGLLGLALSDSPTIALPRKMEHLLERATPTGMTLMDLYIKAIVETLTTGKFTLMLEPKDNQILFVPYVAESLINWKVRRSLNSKATDAQLLVFEEWNDDSQDFDHNPTASYVVCRDLGAKYVVEHYNADQRDPSNILTPSYKGKSLDFIPFVTMGSISNGLDANPIPLYSISSTSMQIYMRTADLGNSEFLSCNPTLIMTGVDEEQSPRALGSTVVITLPNEQAKVFYTETDTSALNHVMTHINDLYERAVYFGAQLLDSSKKAAESAETTRLKQASSGATLSSVITNVAMGFEKALKMSAEWQGLDSSEIAFKPITEFMAPALTANEQQAMVKSWVAGAISKHTLIDNFRRAGVLPAGSSVEDELAKIQSELPLEEELEEEEENSDNIPNPADTGEDNAA